MRLLALLNRLNVCVAIVLFTLRFTIRLIQAGFQTDASLSKASGPANACKRKEIGTLE